MVSRGVGCFFFPFQLFVGSSRLVSGAVTTQLLYFLHLPLWLIPWPSFIPSSLLSTLLICWWVLLPIVCRSWTLPGRRTWRRFFWRPWLVARSRARILKLSLSSLSSIRDSFSRESSFFLMWDSTWWWPLPWEKIRRHIRETCRNRSRYKKVISISVQEFGYTDCSCLKRLIITFAGYISCNLLHMTMQVYLRPNCWCQFWLLFHSLAMAGIIHICIQICATKHLLFAETSLSNGLFIYLPDVSIALC